MTGDDLRLALAGLCVGELPNDDQLLHLTRRRRAICNNQFACRRPFIPPSLFITSEPDPKLCVACRQMLRDSRCGVCGRPTTPGQRICGAACASRLSFDVVRLALGDAGGAARRPVPGLHLLQPSGATCRQWAAVAEHVSRDVRDFLNDDDPCLSCVKALENQLRGYN